MLSYFQARTSSVKFCKLNPDCGSQDECCVQNAFTFFSAGTCYRKLDLGENCHIGIGHIIQGFLGFNIRETCGCIDGLVCRRLNRGEYGKYASVIKGSSSKGFPVCLPAVGAGTTSTKVTTKLQLKPTQPVIKGGEDNFFSGDF